MKYDVIVVGGSYAGLSAAMQLARARRRVLVIDAGLPRNRFAKAGHGFFGQDGKAPRDILQEARGQLSAYPTVEFLNGEAIEARKTGDEFAVTLRDRSTKQASRLILATGVRDELPPVSGLSERWGLSVFHCPYCHGYEVAGQALGVLANHGMSVHQAMLLSDWGPTIYFTGGMFEPEKEEEDHLRARGIGIERAPVVELLGDAPKLEAVRLSNGIVVPISALFTAPKTQLASPLAEQLGCTLDQGPTGPSVRVDDWKQTSVPGVYAAGDAAATMHNATFASSSGVAAGIGAHRSLLGII